MTSAGVRHEFDWYFSMHLARFCTIFSFVLLLRSSLMILPLLLGLSYVEICPMRALRLFGGDKTLDPENKDRSRD